jgi:hypothetical protein
LSAGELGVVMAPAVQTLIFGLRLCLPAAPVLPGDNEKFGTILVLWAALGQAERLAYAAKVQRSRTTRQPRDLLRLLTAAIGRFCCKSRFALVTENSAGRGRGFRVKM